MIKYSGENASILMRKVINTLYRVFLFPYFNANCYMDAVDIQS